VNESTRTVRAKENERTTRDILVRINRKANQWHPKREPKVLRSAPNQTWRVNEIGGTD